LDLRRSLQSIVLLLVVTEFSYGGTFTVTNTGDAGAGSLRQQILDANANSGEDTIVFNIPVSDPGYNITGNGEYTIQPDSALPAVSDTLVMDGTTQPGFSARPLIELNGTNLGGPGNGISITAGSSIIRAMVINRSPGAGILITSDDNIIEGCYIGTDVTGTIDLGNGGAGLNLQNSAHNTIGGADPQQRNIISGNVGNGINLSGPTTTGNSIEGNYIGTDTSGTNAIGNDKSGVLIGGDAMGNTVGGNVAGVGNIISSNSSSGVNVKGTNSTDNVIRGNKIGTDRTGTADLGNGGPGILINGEARRAVIGGPSPLAANTIAFNTGAGVELLDDGGGSSNPPSALIRNNSIFGNTGLGIDLDGDGVTANDADDSDDGSNGLQNFPVLDSAVTNGVDTVRVYGSLNSTGAIDFTLEFFADSTADPSGHGEGRMYLGDTAVTTDGTGSVIFSVVLATAVPAGYVVTATATDTSSSTSEFSDTVLTTLGPVLGVSVTNPTFAFGITPANQWLPVDSSFVINDGSVAENFIGQISPLTDGSNTWAISETTNGADSIRAQWSVISAAGPWNDISAYDSDFSIETNVAVSDTVTLYLRIQSPTSTSSYNEHASTVTVTAQQF
jgi:hypothetical protein